MNYLSCRKHVFGLFLVGGLLLPAGAWAQTAATSRPVAPDLLQNGELVVKSGGFAIATPVGEWQWSLMEDKGTTPPREVYLCVEAATGAAFSVVAVDARTSLDDRFMAGFTQGVEESMTASGWKVVSMRKDRSAVPLPGSYRCAWQVVLPDGSSRCGYSYVGMGDAVYVLQHITPDTVEPLAFTEFARSLRLLHAPRSRTTPGSLMVGYLLLVGLTCGAAAIVNQVSRRPILNGGTIGMVVVVVGFVAVLVLGGYAGVTRGLSPEQLGEVIGRRTGEVLLPLILAGLASYAFRKHKARWQARVQRPDASQELIPKET